MLKKIVLTGGPCAGKTTALALLKQWLEDRGFTVITLWETARTLIEAGFSARDIHLYKDSLAWQKVHFSLQCENETHVAQAIADLKTEKPIVLLLDRSILDCRGFLPTTLSQQLFEYFHITVAQAFARYDMVIHMQTAAIGAEEFYTVANDAARTETPEEARNVDQALWYAYQGHPHHVLIDNSTGIDQKIRRVLDATARVIGIPEPMEIERKWVVQDITVPDYATRVTIIQHYLRTDDPAVERRVRMRCIDGTCSYYYTEKRDVSVGTREENEHSISETEWQSHIVRDVLADTLPIIKDRYVWEYKGHTFEYDVFRGHLSDLKLLEIEVRDLNEPLDLWVFNGYEVTGDKRFSNRVLATFK